MAAILIEITRAGAVPLTLILTVFKMSSFPQGGDSAPPIVDALPYSPNCALCKAVRLGTCTGYYSFKEIWFVAFATKISSYRIFKLRQNSMHFVKKSYGWKEEIIWIFSLPVKGAFAPGKKS